ncbi:hypothetical protein A2856_00565 [Candidatus Uhrbacteria bacterium RIFCSPHIGHO2_01_FULL_63_20]|uniref:Addiction module toxin, HicA family n=1 Tax=Candidatus Uhrbacteria bacterium RIFCSPHIGHO2_01_FULL_63_20 TaxID=1802385 RepID=A0A1F7TLX0_9BACT|nr:MAG: hypothetical protein A2856_00565 [Candidatus Uhrbacteria bacterium RIFCSPHIGHO2_01_FULL_63_20]
MAKTVSGKYCVKILCRYFGFFVVSQKGSHIKLRRMVGRQTVTTIVPNHPELSIGTLRGVLELAEVDEAAFLEHA